MRVDDDKGGKAQLQAGPFASGRKKVNVAHRSLSFRARIVNFQSPIPRLLTSYVDRVQRIGRIEPVT